MKKLMNAMGYGTKQCCGEPWNVVECAELMNKFPIEGSLLRRGSVRRFCGCGNNEQNLSLIHI